MIPLLLAAALAAPVSDEVVAACDAAVASKEVDALHDCVEAWVIADAEDPLTDYYGFHYAFARQDTTAAEFARKRALAHGLDGPEAAEIKKMGLPKNPMVMVQRVFLGVVLLLALSGMVWARSRSLRGVDGPESASGPPQG